MSQDLAVRNIQYLPLEKASPAAVDFAMASKSDATRLAYRLDAAHFVDWCDRRKFAPLPASVDTVAAYLADLASFGLKAATIDRRRAGIRYMHLLAGHRTPTDSEAIKAVMAGIRRTLGTRVERKTPATAETMRAIIADIPTDLRGLRDRALLLLGFAAALRRSELVALNFDDLEPADEGLLVNVRRSKTDQEGKGDFVSVPHGSRLRPVAALQAWLDAAEITEGAVFRSIWKGGAKVQGRLTTKSIASIIKKRFAAAGFDPTNFSGHSLRSGFVTSALYHGADILRSMAVTRHKDVSTLKMYDRRAKTFKQHAGEAFL